MGIEVEATAGCTILDVSWSRVGFHVRFRLGVFSGAGLRTGPAALATVTLPDWFEALNQDFRYQLSVIGSRAKVVARFDNVLLLLLVIWFLPVDGLGCFRSGGSGLFQPTTGVGVFLSSPVASCILRAAENAAGEQAGRPN